MAFGYGDGGGGPTREMLENLQLLTAFPALPRVRQRPAADFFRDLELAAGPRLPVWNGELYLELHRGTYTTQSRNKRANRRCEFRLHDAEFLAAFASQVEPAYPYPAEAFTQAWRMVCLNQFHDVLPGSGIGAIYVESLAAYAEAVRIASEVQAAALGALSGHIAGDLLLVNPTSFARSDLALYPAQLPSGAGLALPDGKPVLSQTSSDGTWLDAGEVPPFSLTALVFSKDGPAATSRPLTVAPNLLANDFVRIELNAAGDITRVYDKAHGRDVLAPGAVANQFQAFEDRPKDWEAWDIDIFYDDKQWLAEPAQAIRVAEAGPLRATLEIRRRILHSTYTQRLSLAHNSPRLDIETVIDWRERHILLKAAFPVDVLAPAATYEIQWGNVQRPTHRNTSWDWARFETCAQKWVDLSEGGYGVSLLNDCKYGHDVQGNVLRLSLLRSPTYPDPEADQGEQRFTYSLLPHSGGWDTGGTIPAAYALNDPLFVWPAERGTGGAQALPGALAPMVQCDSPNIVIETVKLAEDGQGLILRLYESHRRRGEVTLTAGFPLAAVQRTNLLEENQATLTPQGHQVTLFVKPYEIVTLRLTPAQARPPGIPGI
jgi:alpha-mannosidase